MNSLFCRVGDKLKFNHIFTSTFESLNGYDLTRSCRSIDLATTVDRDLSIEMSED